MIYVFDEYELDTERYELRFRRAPLHIEPKAFELLAYMVQHHGHFVAKEDLQAHLWPHQLVSKSALTYCVTVARKAIGDNGRDQHKIRTVYARGYRFVAPVKERLHGRTEQSFGLSPGAAGTNSLLAPDQRMNDQVSRWPKPYSGLQTRPNKSCR
jgi:DNA-binding winged helix-turn-helix (wHTH) protein